MHLLGNMLFLWVCGVLLEDAWGRPVFLALYLLVGLVCLAPDLWLRDEYVRSIGASGAISGVMGAFAVRFWNVRLRILVMLGILTRTVWVSSWVILLFWLAKDIAGIATQLVGDTTTDHMAHVSGFAFGAAVALVFRRTNFEESVLAARVQAKSVHLVHRNEPVERAFDEFDRELHPVARKRLSMTVEREPENVDAAVALWDAAMEDGGSAGPGSDLAQEAMVRAIQAEVRAGDVENATDHWRELLARNPLAALDPRTTLLIGECLERRGLRQESGEAMAKAVEASDVRTPTAVLLRIGKFTMEVEPRVSAAAAAAVLARGGVSPEEQAMAIKMGKEAEARTVRIPSTT